MFDPDTHYSSRQKRRQDTIRIRRAAIFMLVWYTVISAGVLGVVSFTPNVENFFYEAQVAELDEDYAYEMALWEAAVANAEITQAELEQEAAYQTELWGTIAGAYHAGEEATATETFGTAINGLLYPEACYSVDSRVSYIETISGEPELFEEFQAGREVFETEGYESLIVEVEEDPIFDLAPVAPVYPEAAISAVPQTLLGWFTTIPAMTGVFLLQLLSLYAVATTRRDIVTFDGGPLERRVWHALLLLMTLPAMLAYLTAAGLWDVILAVGRRDESRLYTEFRKMNWRRKHPRKTEIKEAIDNYYQVYAEWEKGNATDETLHRALKAVNDYMASMPYLSRAEEKEEALRKQRELLEAKTVALDDDSDELLAHQREAETPLEEQFEKLAEQQETVEA